MILFMILCAHERKLLVSSKIVYALLVHCAKLKLSDVLLACFNSTLKKEQDKVDGNKAEININNN